MNCNICGYLGRDGDAFCYSCGKPLAGPAPDAVSQEKAASGTVPWRGGQVAAGILLILAGVFPVTGIAILMGKLAGRFEQAVGAWESSHLMGFAILIVVWGLGLRPRRLTLSSLGLIAPVTSMLRTGFLTTGALGASLLFTFLYANLVDYLGWQILAPPEIPGSIVFRY